MKRIIDMEWRNTIPFTQEQLQEMAWRYERGETVIQLSDRYGICRTAVTSRLVTLGVVMRGKGSRKQVTSDVIQKVAIMRGRGRSWSEIARDLGFSAEYLMTKFREYRRQNENALPVQ